MVKRKLKSSLSIIIDDDDDDDGTYMIEPPTKRRRKHQQQSSLNVSMNLRRELIKLRRKYQGDAGDIRYVFSDATLDDLCHQQPTTIDALKSIDDITDYKVNRYGNAIIDCIQTWKVGDQQSGDYAQDRLDGEFVSLLEKEAGSISADYKCEKPSRAFINQLVLEKPTTIQELRPSLFPDIRSYKLYGLRLLAVICKYCNKELSEDEKNTIQQEMNSIEDAQTTSKNTRSRRASNKSSTISAVPLGQMNFEPVTDHLQEYGSNEYSLQHLPAEVWSIIFQFFPNLSIVRILHCVSKGVRSAMKACNIWENIVHANFNLKDDLTSLIQFIASVGHTEAVRSITLPNSMDNINEASFRKLVTTVPYVTSLSITDTFRHSHFTIKTLLELTKWSYLEELKLNGIKLTGAALKTIAQKCPLKVLELHNCSGHRSNAFNDSIRILKHIERIEIKNCAMFDSALIGNMRKELQHLIFCLASNKDFSEASVTDMFHRFYDIKTVHLDVPLQYLKLQSRCPTLESFSFGRTSGHRYIGPLFTRCKITAKDWICPKLQTLILLGVTFDLNDLTSISQNLPKLEKLTLNDAHILGSTLQEALKQVLSMNIIQLEMEDCSCSKTSSDPIIVNSDKLQLFKLTFSPQSSQFKLQSVKIEGKNLIDINLSSIEGRLKIDCPEATNITIPFSTKSVTIKSNQVKQLKITALDKLTLMTPKLEELDCSIQDLYTIKLLIHSDALHTLDIHGLSPPRAHTESLELKLPDNIVHLRRLTINSLAIRQNTLTEFMNKLESVNELNLCRLGTILSITSDKNHVRSVLNLSKSKLTSCRILNVSDCHITGFVMNDPLKQTLQTINFGTSTSVSAETIESLTKYENLTYCKLENITFGHDTIELKHDSITSLDIGSTAILLNEGSIQLKIPKLKTLKLSGSFNNLENMLPAENEVETLHMKHSSVQLPTSGMKLPHLQHLDIYRCITGLINTSKMPKLVSMRLCGCSQMKLNDFSNNNVLKEIKVMDSSIQSLEFASTSLEQISLTGNSVDRTLNDAGTVIPTKIGALPSLKSMRVFTTNLDLRF
jgi:hypothetical protein